MNITEGNTEFIESQAKHRTSASAEYFERFVLGNRGHDWYNFGHVRWESFLCLAAAWILVALCLIKVKKCKNVSQKLKTDM